MKIMPNILYNIGNTPLVKVNSITKSEGIKCEIRELNVVADLNGGLNSPCWPNCSRRSSTSR